MNPKEVTITAGSASKTYNGSALTESGFTASDLETGDTHEFAVVMTADSTITNIGTKANVIATVDGVAVTTGTETAVGNYLVTTANGTLTVNPKEVTITANDASRTYNGSALTESGFTASDLETGDTHEFTVVMTADSTITNAGTKPNVIATVDGVEVTTGTETAVGNYLVTTANGTLTISKAPLTITANDQTYTYNGKEQGEGDTVYKDPAEIADKVTAVGLQGTDALTQITLDGQAKDAGTHEGALVPSNAVIGSATDNYTITYVPGNIIIEKLAVTVTITGNKDSKTYNGEEQTLEGYDVEISDPLYTKDDFAFSGDAVAKGTDAGTYKMGLSKDQFTNNNNNFDITFAVTDGELTITAVIIDPDDPDAEKDRITVTDPEDTTYNGKEQKQPVTIKDNKTGKTLEPDKDYTVEYTSAVDAGTVTVTITGKGNYQGTFTRKYKINPAEVVITTGSASKAYDGKALTNAEASIEGLVNGETATVTATGSQTEIGSSENTYDIDWGKTKASNYKVTENLGTLMVTEPDTAVITYDLAGGTYNGSGADILEAHKIGDVIKIHEAPVREGYVFSYWQGSAYQPGESYTVTGDHKFTAIWVAIEPVDDDDDDSDGGSSNKGVRTGDESGLAGWLVLMLLAGAGAGGIGYSRRRRED